MCFHDIRDHMNATIGVDVQDVYMILDESLFYEFPRGNDNRVQMYDRKERYRNCWWSDRSRTGRCTLALLYLFFPRKWLACNVPSCALSTMFYVNVHQRKVERHASKHITV